MADEGPRTLGPPPILIDVVAEDADQGRFLLDLWMIVFEVPIVLGFVGWAWG